jgi:hypothetical protein
MGLYRYLMQFDTTVPRPYPPLKLPAYEEMQRKYGEFLERMPPDDDDEDDVPCDINPKAHERTADFH